MKLHAFGDERLWWDLEGIDAIEWATTFYQQNKEID
jgi:hypothetical protein